MNNEELYDQLEGYIHELTEEYTTKLKFLAKEIIGDGEGTINLEELEDYLQAQQHIFMERLERTIKEIKQDVDNGGDIDVQENALMRIKKSFSKIFESVVSTLKDILKGKDKS